MHLGLLVIIFALISLNFISNFITYNARVAEKKAITANLQSAAIAISRTLSEKMPNPPANSIEECKRQYGLSGLTFLPSQPENSSAEARKKWFLDFAHRLNTEQVPDIGRKILGAEYYTMTRGENDEYFFVYPIHSRGGKYLLIFSVNSPELAYLDDSGNMLMTITVISTLLIMFTYYLLARYIFTPFRKLRRQAVESGRVVLEFDNEADAVVEDYRTVISELKDKEQKLLQLNELITRRANSLEQFNNYLLQSTNSGIVTFDRAGRILSINEFAADLLDIVAAEFIGDSCDKLFLPDSEIGKSLRAVTENRQNQPYRETELAGKNVKRKVVGFSISTVSDDHQQPIGASIVISDVNEIISLRQELEGKNRLAALGEMSGGLAHQLRNSMGSIIGYCNLLKKQITKDNLSEPYFDELFAEVKETESLVKRFLSFARPLEFLPEPTDLCQLLRETVAGYKTTDSSLHLEFICEREIINAGEPIVVSADALLMKQALNNIIDNAVSACEGKEGQIKISIGSSETAVTISVCDNGRGIPEDEIDKVFTPFFSSKPSGTGLGLPLAAKIVDLHGGHISVESEVGIGATFRIHLTVKVPSEAVPSVR